MIKTSKFVLLCLLLILVFGLFSVKIWDPDFWWHLKTGEYIFQTGSLPETDPFAYTSLRTDPLNPDSKRIPFLLTSYWLAQVIFYWIYKASGFQGIIYLRAAILAFLVWLVYRGARREGIGFYTSIIAVIPSAIIFSHYTGERPQLFSFLFSFLFIYLLEGFRKASSSNSGDIPVQSSTGQPRLLKPVFYLLPLPFLMFLWTNMHGGVFIGIFILLVYITGEPLKYRLKRFGRPLPLHSIKYLAAGGILSILFFLMNPNGLDVFPVLAESAASLYNQMIVESLSPFTLLDYGMYRTEFILYLALAALCLLLLLLNRKQLDLVDMALFAGFFIMSARAARTIPFFASVSTFLIARYGGMTLQKLARSSLICRVRNIAAQRLSLLKSSSFQTSLPLVLSLAIWIVLVNSSLFQSGVRWERYPAGAANFLKQNRIEGNMFNPYFWGGYLIWALYPDYKVFVDGRGLIGGVYFQEQMIMSADQRDFGGVPAWKALLKAYQVNFILTYSVINRSGELVRLVPELISDPEWGLIYMDNNSLIFVRNSPVNAELINRSGMPKEWAWNEVITEAALKLKNSRNNINFYLTIGDAYMAKKDYPDARIAYLKAWTIQPGNPLIRAKIDSLNVPPPD